MRRRNRRGFALLEATGALFVATLGVFGVVQMFSVAAGEVRTLHEKEIAGRLLRNEMELVTSQPWVELAPGTREKFASPAPELERLRNAAPGVEVAVHADRPDTLRIVTVRLRWTSTNGRTVEQALTTLVARDVR